jgi:hypothetical protein
MSLDLLSVDIITKYILCIVLKKNNLEVGKKRLKKTNVSVDIIYHNE